MIDDPYLERVVERAASLSPEEREAYLDEACQGDPESRARVESALRERGEETPIPSESMEDLPTRTMFIAADPYHLEGTSVGHYEIRKRLGKGGMGVVYRAHDSSLNRPVALKFLLLTLSDEPHHRERFFAEARSASALDHNNICTIHEFGETDDGKGYIVMAYYEGETLSRKLQGGPLPLETAIDYGVQIARGLAAAHAKGIFHRDMKPANVMITEPGPVSANGTAKILDFGLAKIEGHNLTRTGTTLGTIAYMSPEQARGERVDQRADVWSLGVILYEALTGRRPFVGRTDTVVSDALLYQTPVPLRELNEEVPEELEAVVLKCLEKDPEQRYQQMDDLLAELRGFLAPDSQAFSGVLVAPAVTPPPRRRLALSVGGAILALLVLALSIPASRTALLRSIGAAPPPAAQLVAVLPFINTLGASPENQALADGLTFSMTGLVARLGTVQESLWTVPASEIVLQEVTTAPDALRFFGVDRVLSGSVQQLGRTTEIVLSLIDPSQDPPVILDSRTVVAPVSPSLRERALDELADLLGVESEVRARLSADTEGGTSPEVYTLYLQGLGFLQRYDQAGNLDDAIRVFGEALDGDGFYGPAHAGLCEALWQKFNQTDDVSLTSQAVASCERAAELSSGQASVLVTVGRSYLEMGDNRRATEELRKALELEPGSADAYRWLGWAAFLDGRPEDSEVSFRTAIELEPRLWIHYNDFGETLHQSGRHEEALAAFEESRRLTPENYLAYNALAVAQDELNQVGAAERNFRHSIELRPNPMAYRNLGYMSFRDRRYEQAVVELESARDLLEEYPSFNDWILWNWLAHAYYWAGDKTKAEGAWRHAIEVATPLYEVNPKDVDVLALLCDSYAALGDVERTRFYQGRLLALPVDTGYVNYYLGRSYEILGDRELALTYIRQALEARFDSRSVDSDPWLADLRTEPEYQALRQQYLPSSG